MTDFGGRRRYFKRCSRDQRHKRLQCRERSDVVLAEIFALQPGQCSALVQSFFKSYRLFAAVANGIASQR